MENSSATQPSGSEKPAGARFSSPPQPANAQHAQHAQQHLQHLQPMGLPRPEPFRNSKPFAVSKLVLGSLNLAFAIIALGLTLALVTTSFRLSSFIGVVICMSLVCTSAPRIMVKSGTQENHKKANQNPPQQAVASLVWQLAEHTTLLVRRDWRSIHPGAHVGVHLVLSVLAILVALQLYWSTSSMMRHYKLDSECEGDNNNNSYYSDYPIDDSYYCDFYSFATQAAADSYIRTMQALAAFATLLFICHVTLFVMACVETDKRRKYGKTNKVVYLVAAPGPVDGRVHYTQGNIRGSVLGPQHVHHQQQGNADPGVYGYYAPPAGVAPGTAA